jgi:hypothetical protein
MVEGASDVEFQIKVDLPLFGMRNTGTIATQCGFSWRGQKRQVFEREAFLFSSFIVRQLLAKVNLVHQG